VVAGDVLRDHAAHRDAGHVRALDAQVREQGHVVVGEVGEPVRQARAQAEQARRDGGRQGGGADVVVAGRVADVAIVDGDAAEAAREQRVEQAGGPGHALHREAHDQQQRLAALGPEHFVVELDAVDERLRHQPFAGSG